MNDALLEVFLCVNIYIKQTLTCIKTNTNCLENCKSYALFSNYKTKMFDVLFYMYMY